MMEEFWIFCALWGLVLILFLYGVFTRKDVVNERGVFNDINIISSDGNRYLGRQAILVYYEYDYGYIDTTVSFFGKTYSGKYFKVEYSTRHRYFDKIIPLSQQEVKDKLIADRAYKILEENFGPAPVA